MDPNNFQPVSQVNPNELPDGFTMHDPHKPSGQSNADSNAMEQKKAETEAILEQVLTGSALARLRRVRMVNPQQAAAVERGLIQMATSVRERITEAKLIEFLERGHALSQKKAAATSSISIERKRYTVDSDDDDDNDDDLL